MKELKMDVQVVLQFLLFVLVVISIMMVKERLVTTFFMGIWLGFLGFSIFSKIQYRRGKADYLLLPTVKDGFSRTNSWVLGAIIVLLSLAASMGDARIQEFGKIGLLVGLLTILSSILALPIGMFKAEEQQLELFGVKTPFLLDQIKEIHVYPNYLLVRNYFGEDHLVQHMQLNASCVGLIQGYLANNEQASDIAIVSHF